MKKRLAVFMLTVFIIGCLTGCGGNAVTRSAVVEGSIFGGTNEDRISVDVSFDIEWLTKGKNTSYNPDLAQFCALLSADSYFRTKDLDKQRQNRVLFDDISEEDYDFTSFLTGFGFTEAEHYESYLYQEDPTDSNDSVTLNIGHQTVDGKYDVYAVVVRGCFSAQEWKSAFDPGCEDAAYTEMTGEHPEWTNRDNFKGVDIAANRALAFISDFMERTGDPSLPDRILITGHSRGGGIANILGACFEKDENAASYTYTFNAMGVTFAEDAKDYRTIFNIYDSSDFFTDTFPFAGGSFARYGTDMPLSVPEKALQQITDLKGRDDYGCVSEETAETYRTLFSGRFADRGMLCDRETVTRTFAAEAEAVTSREECLKLIGSAEGFGLEDLCTIGEIETSEDGTYSYTFEYCGAALLRSYAMILAYGGSACDAVLTLFSEDTDACGIASLLLENAAAVNGGHLLINSYVIAGTLR